MQNDMNEKFVQRFQNSVAEFVILHQATQRPNVTPEIVTSAIPKGNINLPRETITKSFDRLVQDGHLKKDGTNYTITDDGREDVQKLQTTVLELPTLVNKQGSQTSQQRPGMEKPAGVTGSSGSSYGSQGSTPSSPTNPTKNPTQGSQTGTNPNPGSPGGQNPRR